jgi:hypothetical protein
MFTEQTLNQLRCMDITLSYTNDLTEKEKQDVHYMYETNLKRPGKRNKEQVFIDTLRGYFCELALNRCVTNCIDNAPVTKGAIGLSYIQRKTDKIIDGFKVEIKSWNEAYIDTMPMTEAQSNSITNAISMNDYFIMMGWSQIKKMRYRIRPFYIVKANTIQECFKSLDWQYSKVGIDTSRLLTYNENIELQSEVI